MKTVDVIFITYNQELYVAQGIESVISQKVRDDVNVRVIVADDCSTDNTLAIIKSYEVESPFEFVYTDYGQNLGYHENYHRTFLQCKGDYVVILEGDDWWHSHNHIMQHVDFLESHKKFSMSFNQIRFFDSLSEKYNTAWNLPSKFNYYPITLKDQIIKGNQLGNLSACVFRKCLIDTIPNELYESNFADWDLSMWMAQYGPIGFLKGDTSTYRVDYKGQWTKLDDITKKESMSLTLDYMDSIFKYKYHKWFEHGRYNIQNGISPLLYVSWKTKIKNALNIR